MITRAEFRARLALNRHKLGRRLARPAPPDGQARVYARKLKKINQSALDILLAELLPVLKALPQPESTLDNWTAFFQPPRGMFHHDAQGAIGRAIDEAEKKFWEKWNTEKIASMVEPVAGDVDRFQAQALNATLRPVVGVNVFEPGLTKAMAGFTERNVKLIKTIPSRLFSEVQKEVTAEASKGERWENLAKVIQERFSVSQSRAKLIARDQVGKFYGELNRERQRSVGIRKATWRTAGDNRVREEHEELNGEVYDLDKPPDGGPGHAVNCRCYDDPDLESALTAEPEPEAQEPEEGADPEAEGNDPDLPTPEPEATVEPMSPAQAEAELRAKFERENQENLEKIRAGSQFRKDPSVMTEEQIQRLSPEKQDLARDAVSKAKLAREARERRAQAAQAQAKANAEGKDPDAHPDIKTYPLLAAVYLNQRQIERGETLTHSYREGEATTLCRRIKAEKLSDSFTATNDPPECAACLGRDPRFD